jgi:hypothetical protein
MLYTTLVAANSEVELKGVTMPYTSRNGHMFSFLDEAGTMSLRLSPDDRREFLDRYRTTLAEQHGRQMNEYVVVPHDLLERTGELEAWFDRSHSWAGSLKPKPTKRG